MMCQHNHTNPTITSSRPQKPQAIKSCHGEFRTIFKQHHHQHYSHYYGARVIAPEVSTTPITTTRDLGLILSRLCGVPIVTLYVGQDRNAFHVHLDLLYMASPVFKAAFFGSFKESDDCSMSLPEDEICSIDRFVQWLYTKRYELDGCATRQEWNSRFYQMAKLNTFADKYGTVALKNTIVDEVFMSARGNTEKFMPPICVINYVFAHTDENSSFRKLMVAWYAWRVKVSWYTEESTKEILLDCPEFA